MRDQIKELFATMIQASPGDITAAATPQDFPRWDSMQHLIIVASLEGEFGIDIDPDEIITMFESYGAFEEIVVRKID